MSVYLLIKILKRIKRTLRKKKRKSPAYKMLPEGVNMSTRYSDS